MRRNDDVWPLLLGLSLAACGRVWLDPLPGSDDPDPDLPPHLELDASSDDAGQDLPTEDDASLQPNAPVGDAGTPVRDAGLADASPRDAGLPDAGAADAGRTDAGAPDAGADAGTSACAGTRVFGVCWYLGSGGASCNQTCSPRGGYDPRATGYVGTSSQGGSVDACTQIMRALGRQGSVGEGMRSDGNGFGCHVWPDGRDGANWWLASPSFTPSVAAGSAAIQIVCGCLR